MGADIPGASPRGAQAGAGVEKIRGLGSRESPSPPFVHVGLSGCTLGRSREQARRQQSPLRSCLVGSAFARKRSEESSPQLGARGTMGIRWYREAVRAEHELPEPLPWAPSWVQLVRVAGAVPLLELLARDGLRLPRQGHLPERSWSHEDFCSCPREGFTVRFDTGDP